MTTLEQHEQERAEWYMKLKESSLATGVECPRCKMELLKTYNDIMLASIPPKCNVNCPRCNWTGYMNI